MFRSRGLLGSVNTLNVAIGYLYGLMIGSLVPVKYVPWVIVGPCVMFILLSCFMVESPVWLMKHNNPEEARKVLTMLRGLHYNTEAELTEIETLLSSKKMKNTLGLKISSKGIHYM